MSVSSLRRRFLRRDFIWPLAIVVLILSASSRSRVANVNVRQSDKVAHFAVFGLLGTLVCRIGRGDKRAAAWALVTVSAFGASDEFHQSFVPGRSATVSDWVADTAGAALAIALYTYWTRYRELLEMPLWRRRVRGEQLEAPPSEVRVR